MILELLATVALLLACGWTAYLTAVRWLPAASTSVRLSAATIVAYWTLVAGFLGLASVSLFRAEIAVPLWVAAAVAMHRRGGLGTRGLEALRADRQRAGAVWRECRHTRYGFAAATAIAIAVLLWFVRSLVSPPLAWDTLTYHLLKAGRWVQSGSFVAERAPDAWGYYEYFQPFGDVLWAWAMLPVHGDLLIGPASVLVWATGLLGTYALARTLRVATLPAVLAALFVVTNPVVFTYITAGHVENVLFALFVLGAVFIARSFEHRDGVDAVLAAAAAGVLAGIKFNGAPIAALGFVLVFAVVFRSRARLSPWVPVTCLLAFAVGTQPYLRAWIETGSPVYPFQVAIGGQTLLAGNDQLAWLLAQEGRSRAPLLQQLFVPRWFDLAVARQQFLNPGPGAAIVVIAGLVGLIAAVRRRRDSAIVFYLVVASLVTIVGIASSDVIALRTIWAYCLGRFLIVALASAAIFAAMLPARVSVPLLLAGVAINVPLIIPIGLDTIDVVAMTDPRLAVGLGVLLVLAFVARLATGRGPARRHSVMAAASWAAVAVALVGAWSAVRDVREAHRHAYFQSTQRRANVQEMSAYPIWRQLDGDVGLTIAATAGWNGIGHNWFRYPLLGARLQNRVVYIPITADGSVVDYRDRAAVVARADYRAWLQRLVDGGVEYVVLLPPEAPEAGWVRAHPELFTLVGAGERRLARVYRLNETRAAAELTRHLAAR